MELTAGEGFSRRRFMRGAALAGAGLAAMPAHAFIPMLPNPAQPGAMLYSNSTASAAIAPSGPRPALLQRALTAMHQHSASLSARDLFAIVDFGSSSATPRLHLVDVLSGRSTSLLVAHGRGSDPDHTGYLQRFSNQENSAASSSGAYVTGEIYIGKHGRSRHLAGLDSTNSNVARRSIVVHSAQYVSPLIVAQTGKLGRSEGCFAVSAADLEQVIGRLGAGRMIYADKV